MAIWLKLATNILDDEKIQVIRTMPDGDSLFTLWIGLLCLAMKAETERIYIADDVPYDSDSLAKVLRLNKATVELGMQIFERFRMVQIHGDGGIEICHLSEHQSLEGLERKRFLSQARMKKFRAKLINESSRKLVTHPLRTRYASVTLTEEEEEEDKNRNIVELKLDDAKSVAIINKKTELPVAETTKGMLAFLNERAGTRYRDGAGHRARVASMLKKGYTLEDMKKIIAVKALQWKDDPKMREFLRPGTLFAPSHIDDYLGQYETEKARMQS